MQRRGPAGQAERSERGMRASITSPLVPRKGSMPAARKDCAHYGRWFTIGTRSISVYSSQGTAYCNKLFVYHCHSLLGSDWLFQNGSVDFISHTKYALYKR